ncbi:hypothetical protein ACTVCO_01670 [Sanguibacter sp. A247]|uniref:hypothetical protein n=1 Tax=unclassified Sanguibacter TaxID=2645534 RepID=UPI003FD7043C
MSRRPTFPSRRTALIAAAGALALAATTAVAVTSLDDDAQRSHATATARRAGATEPASRGLSGTRPQPPTLEDPTTHAEPSPGATTPGQTSPSEPTPTQPGTEPGTAEPGTEPSTTAPGEAAPGTTDPADPHPTDPGTTEPGTTDPTTTRPPRSPEPRPTTSAPREPAPAPTTTTPPTRAPEPEPEPEPTTPATPVPQPEPRSSFPGPGTTGVPHGTSLKVHEGDLVVSKAGTVIDRRDIRGLVRIDANDVTIKRSIVQGRKVTQQSYLVQISPGVTGTKIVDTEIYAAHPSHLIKGVVGSRLRMTRTNVHTVIDQLSTTGGGVVVTDSWFHDNLHYASDPLHGGGPSHDDNVQISSGSGFAFVGNRFEGSRSASIMIVQGARGVSDVRVEDSFIDGGACSINVAENGRGPISGVAVTGVTFGLNTGHRGCAIISPRTTKITHSGNVFTDGRSVTISPGD